MEAKPGLGGKSPFGEVLGGEAKAKGVRGEATPRCLPPLSITLPPSTATPIFLLFPDCASLSLS